MFEQVGADEFERSSLRLRIIKSLIVTAAAVCLFVGLFLMTQFAE